MRRRGKICSTAPTFLAFFADVMGSGDEPVLFRFAAAAAMTATFASTFPRQEVGHMHANRTVLAIESEKLPMARIRRYSGMASGRCDPARCRPKHSKNLLQHRQQFPVLNKHDHQRFLPWKQVTDLLHHRADDTMRTLLAARPPRKASSSYTRKN